MTAIVSFPLPPAMQARISARDDAVTAARTILRSEAPHTRATIREACHALMTYGNQWDWVEAYNVMRAMDKPVPRPPYSAGTGMIRAALVDIAEARNKALDEAAAAVENHFPGTLYASNRTKVLAVLSALKEPKP